MSLNPSLEQVRVYNPADSPVRGMASSRHPASLNKGEFYELQNWRLSDYSLKVRGAVREIAQGASTGLRTSGNLGGSAAPDAGTAFELGNSGVIATLFRGAFNWNGTMYAAYANVNETTGALLHTHLYKSSDLSAWSRVYMTWTGNGSSNEEGWWTDNWKLCTFTPVKAPVTISGGTIKVSEEEVLIVSQGPEAVTVGSGYAGFSYSPSNGNPPAVVWSDGIVGFHRELSAPEKVGKLQSIATFPHYVNIGSDTSATVNAFTSDTYATPQSQFDCVVGGGPAADGHTLYVDLNTSLAGYNCSITYTDFDGANVALDIADSDQLVFVYDTVNIKDFWNRVKLEIGDGTNWGTIWNPSDPSCVRIEHSFNDDTDWAKTQADEAYTYRASRTIDSLRVRQTPLAMMAFPKDQIDWGTSTPTDDITSFRFTLLEDYSGTQIIFEIYCICASGSWQGLGQWGQTLFNLRGQSESPGVVIPIGGGALTTEIGGSSYLPVEIPEVPLFYYSYSVPVQSAKAAEYADYALLYRRDWGSETFYGVSGSSGFHQLTELSGTPGYTDSTSATGTFTYKKRAYNYVAKSDWPTAESVAWKTVGYDALDTRRIMPDALHLPLPAHDCAVWANGRLIAGSGSKVWVSEYGNPFRYRWFPRYENGVSDPYSPSVREMQGERVVGMKAVSASMVGANQVYVWTDKTLAALDGADPNQPMNNLGQIGCVGQRALAAFKNQVWMIDDERQVRIYNNGGTGDKTREVVDDLLDAVPSNSIDKAGLYWWRDRLYCSFQEQGANWATAENRIVLVYDPRNDAWTVDREFPAAFGAQQFARFAFSGTEKLVAFGGYGRVFVYDSATEGEKDSVSPDTGANTPTESDIETAIETAEFSDGLFTPMLLGRIGLTVDPMPGGSAHIKRIMRSGEGGTSVSASLNPGGWLWSPIDPGACGRGVGGRFRIEIGAPSHWTVHSIVAEVGTGINGPESDKP